MACCADAGRARYKQHEVRYHCCTVLAGRHRSLEHPDLTNGSGSGQTRHDAMEAFRGGGNSRRPSPSSTVLRSLPCMSRELLRR